MSKLEKRKYSVEVKISGPGGVINGDAKMIEEILRAAGYAVNVTNDAEDTDRRLMTIWTDGKNNMSQEEFKKRKIELHEVYKKNIHLTKINLLVDHQPWGG